MESVQFAWRGLTLGALPISVTKVTGWLDLPGGSYENVSSSGHGIAAPRVTQGPRVVTVSGTVRGDRGNPGPALAALRAVMIPSAASDPGTEDLTGTAANVTMTAEAHLTNFALTTDPAAWASGWVPWSAQWLCPDPRLYANWISQSATLVVPSGGAALPATLPLTLPSQPIGGRVTIDNPGNDPEGSPTVYTLTGVQTGSVGITLISNGKTLVYGIGLGASDVLVIDTARGGAYLNGSYRAPSAGSDVTSDFRLPPGVSVIEATGSAGAGSPSLTVAVRPASW